MFDVRRELNEGSQTLRIKLHNKAQLDMFLDEQTKLMKHYAVLREMFDAREAALIQNCVDYARSENPAGLPGHNLMVVIAKLVELAGLDPAEFLYAWRVRPEVTLVHKAKSGRVEGSTEFRFAYEDETVTYEFEEDRTDEPDEPDDCGGCSCDDCTP